MSRALRLHLAQRLVALACTLLVSALILPTCVASPEEHTGVAISASAWESTPTCGDAGCAEPVLWIPLDPALEGEANVGNYLSASAIHQPGSDLYTVLLQRDDGSGAAMAPWVRENVAMADIAPLGAQAGWLNLDPIRHGGVLVCDPYTETIRNCGSGIRIDPTAEDGEKHVMIADGDGGTITYLAESPSIYVPEIEGMSSAELIFPDPHFFPRP